MKVSLSWLKEFIPINQSPHDIANKLTMLGLEVEAIETLSPSFHGVVVARVNSVEKHPNADSLCIASVDDGTQVFQVVCGASNCRVGIKTAFARVGATLFDENGEEFTIKKAKIRGIESFGMLCAGPELHLSDDDSGILELPQNWQEGTDLKSIYEESIFEVAITPNLGHCASIFGIARELSAATGEQFLKPYGKVSDVSKTPIDHVVKVFIEDNTNCPRYGCKVIQNLKVGPSPLWLQKKLNSCGVRSINNVVDVTNFVMMEMGHPLHAFDMDLLEGSQIHVRSAKEGEKIITLDAKERLLKDGMLVIADEKKPVAIAGIMGGIDSEVGLKTVNVLIESAYFDPKNVRRTSKQLGVITDASRRFERGADPNSVIVALERAVMLIQQLAGGNVIEETIDIKSKEFLPQKISCRVRRIQQILGIKLSNIDIEDVFQKLHFPYRWLDQDILLVEVPTYRVDISGEIDLAEEVARIYGYDNFSPKSAHYQSTTFPDSPIFLFERETRLRLIAEGLQEFLNCDLIGPTLLSIVDTLPTLKENYIKVMNPTSIEQSILRTSLLPGLLQTVKYNFDHQTRDTSGFEVGRVHFKTEELFKEQSVAGVILTGNRMPKQWGSPPLPVDFYDLKGIISNVFSELGLHNVCYKPSELSVFHSGRQASIVVDSVIIGSLGEIHPSIVRRLDMPQRIYYAEFDLHDAIQLRKKIRKMHPLPLYPSSERDWTITIKEETTVAEILRIIREVPSKILERVSIEEPIYRNEKLGEGHKNVTFHFVYRDYKKTVSQEEVDSQHSYVTEETLRHLGKSVL